ncbi:MAG: alpha/beta hydrolase [Nitrospira sp.]
MRQRLVSVIGPVLLIAHGLWATGSYAADHEFCVLGQGPELTKTIHLTLQVEGEDPKDKAAVVAAELSKRLVWTGKAEQAYAELYDAEACSSTAERETIRVTLSKADVSSLSTVRGPGEDDGLFASVAKQARRVLPPPFLPKIKGNPYHTIRVYYATNRNDTGKLELNQHFGNEREAKAPRVSYGVVDVSIPKHHRKGELESPSIWKLEFRQDPEQHVTLLAINSLSRDQWRKDLATRATRLGKPGILLFIHGYNLTFRQAAERTGQLAYDLAFAGPTVFFAWPSQGGLATYTVDEQKAEQSILDMGALLSDLADLVPGGPVYIIAHSMGTRVLSHGFKELMTKQLEKRRNFKEIVLAAPDIDATVFKEQIAPKILGVGPRVTLYASSEDKALGLSGPVHGGPRLGKLQKDGSGMTVIRDMDSIDASTVEADFLGHSFFAGNRTVLTDLIDLIRNGLAPEKRPDLESVPGTKYWRFRQ